MATINTDLVMASVPQVDIAGAIGAGISSYYGVKEMQDAQTERDMLLEQRENEVWSSNYNRWKEWGNFVDPANADDYIAKGMEMGVYDQEQADMMLEQIQGSNIATGFPQLQHRLDTALGVKDKMDSLASERTALTEEFDSISGEMTPLGSSRRADIYDRVKEIDSESGDLSDQLKGFDIPALQEQRDEAYAASEASIQGAMNTWRGIGDAYEAFNAGKPYEMYKFNEETGSVETQNVTSEEELESLSDQGWEVTAPELSTYYDTKGEAKIATPQMAYQRGYTEEAPVVEEVDEDKYKGYTRTTAVKPGETAEQYVYTAPGKDPIYTDVFTGEESELASAAAAVGKDAKDFFDKNALMNAVVGDYTIPEGATEEMLAEILQPENKKNKLSNWTSQRLDKAMMDNFSPSELQTMDSRIASELNIPAQEMFGLQTYMRGQIEVAERDEDGNLTQAAIDRLKTLSMAYIGSVMGVE